MKKLIICGCFALGMIFFSNSIALAQSNFKAGGGLAYGTDIEAIGIQAGAVYGFDEDFRGAADIIIFFPEDQNNTDHSFWTVNANVHYLLITEDASAVYGLGGINYATQNFSNGTSVTNSEVGLNLGGGAEFGVDFGVIYLEAKYVISDFDQLVLSGGVRFYL